MMSKSNTHWPSWRWSLGALHVAQSVEEAQTGAKSCDTASGGTTSQLCICMHRYRTSTIRCGLCFFPPRVEARE